jgi:hypothetical protein
VDSMTTGQVVVGGLGVAGVPLCDRLSVGWRDLGDGRLLCAYGEDGGAWGTGPTGDARGAVNHNRGGVVVCDRMKGSVDHWIITVETVL